MDRGSDTERALRLLAEEQAALRRVATLVASGPEPSASSTRSPKRPAASSVRMLTGTYQLEGEVSQRLLRALPPLLVFPSDAWDTPLVELLAEEVVKDEPGEEAVLDRLLDLLLIAGLALMVYASRGRAPCLVSRLRRSRGGTRAADDPEQPGAPLDAVAALAEATNVSRATLARRFTALVGSPR